MFQGKNYEIDALARNVEIGPNSISTGPMATRIVFFLDGRVEKHVFD